MHVECLQEKALRLIPKLKKIVTDGGFILAGGTAAALHMGHRRSHDFDFFTKRHFSNERLLRTIKKWGLPMAVLQEEQGTLTLLIDGIKVSFFEYPYPFNEPRIFLSGIPVAGLVDIASMKMLAITQRGAKRDFADLYCILTKIPSPVIAGNMVARFGRDRISPVVIGKALVNFTDAEADPDPEYLGTHKGKWKEIKQYFVNQVKQIVLDIEKAG